MTERKWSAEEMDQRVQEIENGNPEWITQGERDLVEIIRQMRQEQKEDREAIRTLYNGFVPLDDKQARTQLPDELPAIRRAFEGEPSR